MNRTLRRDVQQVEFWNSKTELRHNLGQTVKRVELHPARLRQRNCELQSVRLLLDDDTITRLVTKEGHLSPENFKDYEHYQRTKAAYEVEIAFYKYLMSANGIALQAKVPSMLYAELDVDSFFIILEDLRRSEGVDRPRGCQRHILNSKETKLALEWLASFHASFLGLKNLPDNLWPKGTFWSFEKRQKEFEDMTSEWQQTCESFKESYPDVFSSKRVLELGHRIQTLAEELDHSLEREEEYKTLLHGDFKTANLFFVPEGVAACDFQWIGAGLGVKDLIYLLYSSVSPSTILHHEDDFLLHYYKSFLLKSQIQSMEWKYPWSDFKRDAEVAFLDYVRFLISSMWGSVTPTSHFQMNDTINQGIHKRNPEHLVNMVKKADELLYTRFKS